MRLVKKTVNQDDVSAYHLFYADGKANPGTDLTFFDFPAAPEQRGTNAISRTGLRVAGEASLGYWRDRLKKAGAVARDIVEVEKVQRADSLQFSHVRARSPHVSCDKCSKIPLSKECDPFRSKPPVKKNRCGFRYRKEHDLVNLQQRCEPCRHAEGMSRKISLRNNLTEERDDECRKGERSNAGEDRIRQQGKKHVDGNVAPEDRG